MTSDDFQKLVQEGIDVIPARFLARLSNVAFVVEDRPSAEQIEKKGTRRRSFLLGLYEGIPLTERGSEYGFVLPDKITIFKREIEDYAKDEKDIPDIVKDTVWHEVAHYFGMDEAEVREKEKRNKKRNRLR
ncbi:MAG: metallopeptidase family protein [Candidatus Paceibacterota bacterium]|jgi:predicted Zn-dependent protease with MMP-like domain|nr:metallopeptidase family protein [Candidatus Paceibacterota bacterium]